MLKNYVKEYTVFDFVVKINIHKDHSSYDLSILSKTLFQPLGEVTEHVALNQK